MTSLHNRAHGAVHLLTDSHAVTASVRRTVRLEAAPDGKSLFMIDVDRRKPGAQREVLYEITPAELIAAIRAHGAALPGERHREGGKSKRPNVPELRVPRLPPLSKLSQRRTCLDSSCRP